VLVYPDVYVGTRQLALTSASSPPLQLRLSPRTPASKSTLVKPTLCRSPSTLVARVQDERIEKKGKRERERERERQKEKKEEDEKEQGVSLRLHNSKGKV